MLVRVLVECLLDPLAKLEDLPVDTVTAWPGPAPSDRIRVRVPSQWAAAPGDTVTTSDYRDCASAARRPRGLPSSSRSAGAATTVRRRHVPIPTHWQPVPKAYRK